MWNQGPKCIPNMEELLKVINLFDELYYSPITKRVFERLWVGRMTLLLINPLLESELMPWGTCRGRSGGSYQLQANTWYRGRSGTYVMYQSMRSGSVTEW